MDEEFISLIKKSFDKVKKDLDEYSARILKLESSNRTLNEKNDKLEKEILVLDNKLMDIKTPKNELHKEFIKKVNRHSRAIIKQKIIDIAATRKLTTPEIKEIIVDQSGYCSKASFYRYLDELKQRNQLNEIEINGIKIVSLP
jgi:uncharacterized coiled-coil DUF342 family protein